jgi:hypothetical protein
MGPSVSPMTIRGLKSRLFGTDDRRTIRGSDIGPEADPVPR